MTSLAEENPDLLDFYGYGEVGVRIRRPRFDLSFDGRVGKEFDKGGVLAGLRLKLSHLQAADLLVQAWSGYGENLLEYNVRDSDLRIGLVITP